MEIPRGAACDRRQARSRRRARSRGDYRPLAVAGARDQLILSIVSAEAFAAHPRPAATVIVLRNGPAGPEVFLVRRHEGTPFMGGAHVFPGGRVDAVDGDAGDSWCDGIAHATRQLDGLQPAAA